MGEASFALHEAVADLSPEIIDRHRAIVSLIEELEAINWYAQRASACKDPELRAILQHNGDEEKEHACMALEWLRRHDPVFDRHLRKFLFREGSIVEAEEHAKEGPERGSKRSDT